MRLEEGQKGRPFSPFFFPPIFSFHSLLEKRILVTDKEILITTTSHGVFLPWVTTTSHGVFLPWV